MLAASTALAPGLVARVADRPIYKTEYDHWTAIYDFGDEGETKPAQRSEEVLGLLIVFNWYDLEAERLNVSVSPAEVRRGVTEAKADEWDTEAEFQEYLRKSGATVADLERSVRFELLVERISKRYVAGAKTDADRSRLYVRNARRFEARFRRMTACGTGYFYKDYCVKEVPLAAATPASASRAAGPPLAPGLVARVADRPIYKTDFDHWMVVADMAADGEVGDDPAELRPQVMQFLLSFHWIDLEAERLGVNVSQGAIDTAFRRQKRQSFPKATDFEKYLAESGQTVEDIKRRVRIDLLSNGIRDRAVARAKTSEGQQRLLERYVVRFTNRYRRQTACGTGYVTEDCVKEVPLSA
ncbi:SurA N-terminal domain-containing protein [Solirubrobacter phytolaccae]|uniref:SurA N-terminal domain-containing protein n=1 Tax=Solirubrobacter phytolaccae TaxID=1404360 RepID=UPI0022CDE505|nr:SurA N-terminal domain-containing protein [Solirubrobacter phytolaccae]